MLFSLGNDDCSKTYDGQLYFQFVAVDAIIITNATVRVIKYWEVSLCLF